MKYILCLSIVILCFGCKERSKYLNEYPFFSNVYSTGSTVSLNNFKSQLNKEGLEYLLDSTGRLIEIRNYKGNLLNGYVSSYATNKKLKALASFRNDTLTGSYMLFDTLSEKITKWHQYLITMSGSIVNQEVLFNDGVVDQTRGHYLTVKKNNDEYELKILGNEAYPYYPYLRMHFIEQNDSNYVFNLDKLKDTIRSTDNKRIIYKVKDKASKYAAGYLLNYRYPFPEEIKENGYDEKMEIGRITYFKIKLY